MPNTNKLYGLHWGIAFGVPFVVWVVLVVLLAGAVFGVGPTPPATSPPSFPPSTVAKTNETGTITLSAAALPAEYEWELTFEWVPEVGSTNVVVYPIKIQVPFEHDRGFVYVRARKVGVRK